MSATVHQIRMDTAVFGQTTFFILPLSYWSPYVISLASISLWDPFFEVWLTIWYINWFVTFLRLQLDSISMSHNYTYPPPSCVRIRGFPAPLFILETLLTYQENIYYLGYGNGELFILDFLLSIPYLFISLFPPFFIPRPLHLPPFVITFIYRHYHSPSFICSIANPHFLY